MFLEGRSRVQISLCRFSLIPQWINQIPAFQRKPFPRGSGGIPAWALKEEARHSRMSWDILSDGPWFYCSMVNWPKLAPMWEMSGAPEGPWSFIYPEAPGPSINQHLIAIRQSERFTQRKLTDRWLLCVGSPWCNFTCLCVLRTAGGSETSTDDCHWTLLTSLTVLFVQVHPTCFIHDLCSIQSEFRVFTTWLSDHLDSPGSQAFHPLICFFLSLISFDLDLDFDVFVFLNLLEPAIVPAATHLPCFLVNCYFYVSPKATK